MSTSAQSSMPRYPLAQHLTKHSSLIYGCMGLGGGWNTNPVSVADIKQTQAIIECCLEEGIRIFDHADIYTFGKAETAFGQVLQHSAHLREKMSIQSKCGIRFEDKQGVKRYDFSSQWITHSVEQILQRLHIEQLDVLLLHRPDPLMQLDDLAQALIALHSAGKIAHIGVSNMHAAQLAFLQSALPIPIIANQIELSLAKPGFINASIEPTHLYDGMAEYAQQHKIQIQAWGALAQGQFTKEMISDVSMNVQHTTNLIIQLAQQYNVSREAIVLAFLTRHPVSIQPIIGTTNLARIKACAQVTQCELSAVDWYGLLESTRGNEVP
jgi:predicted oxidoreductase